MFRRKLFKRVLPVLLSLAMVFETVPGTVLAAEAPVAVEAAAEADDAGKVLEEGAVSTTDAEDALPKAEVKVDVADMMDDLYGYTYDYTTNTIEVKFDKSAEYADAIKDAVEAAAEVSVGGATRTDLEAKLKFQWQKKNAEGAYVDLTAEEKVQAVGSYQLAVSLPAVENVCSASEVASVKLEIQKGVLELGGVKHKNLAAGQTVAEIKRANEDVTFLLNGDTVVKENYVSAVAVSVKEAYTGTVLADTAVLQKNQDYILSFAVTLADAVKDSYEMGETSFNITQGEAVETEIVVTYTTPGKVIGKTYDGEAVDYETIVKPEYTAKVVYIKDGEKKDLAGAELTGVWCDANKAEMKEAPVEAGTYYYRLSYTDKNGTYADDIEYIRVSVQMIDVVVAPTFDGEDVGKDVYEGTSTWEIIRKASYNVYNAKSGEAEEIGDYFWGVAYNVDLGEDYGRPTTQRYEPVLKVQRSEKVGEGDAAKTVWSDYNGTIVKNDKYGYRLVFSGKKAVYDRNGNKYYGEKDINSAQTNYTVDVSEATIEKYAITLNVLAATKVEIKVDDILVEGAGAAFDKPITKTYDGLDLYENKGQYKKASVVPVGGGNAVAQGNDAGLTYTWERMGSDYDALQDENGNIKVPVKPADTATEEEKKAYEEAQEVWESLWYEDDYDVFNNVEYRAAPYNSYVYRLRIDYYDATHANQSATNYVYYVIKPQDSIITMTGTPAIYADGVNDVETLLYRIQNDTEEAAETYVNVNLFPVTLTEGSDGKAVVTKGEEALSLSTSRFYNNPARYFYVEKKIKEGENAGKWQKCEENEIFAEDTEYRLCIGNYHPTNYNFEYKRGIHNQVLKTDYYENESVAINVKKTQGIEVEIIVDEEKIKDNVKIYDGKGFDEAALRKLVKVVTKDEAKTDVTDKVNLHLSFYDETEDWYVSAEGAKHGGTYTPYFFTLTDDTYVAAEKRVETEYEVKKKEISIIPTLPEEILAGKRYSAYELVKTYTVEGLVEGDEEAVSYVSWRLCEAASKNSFNGYLKSGETYYVKASSVGFSDVMVNGVSTDVNYSRDYQADEGVKSFVPIRAAAEVVGGNATIYDEIKKDEKNDYTHTVITRDGVPVRDIDIDNKTVRSNFVTFDLYAPTELYRAYNYSFTDGDYAFENSIKAAGGVILDMYSNHITVAFDAAKHETHSFDILWREDYVEHFTIDLTKSILLDDMSKAVAPKSLKFNGVTTKMVVGGTQQLDVKITKAQMSDIILLGYSVDNKAVLKVEDNGFVTALSKGSATVTVFPCVLENGEKVAISGAKTAKVKINVSDVAVPKLQKITAKDTYATVKYTKPANGFRREIYVLGGKKTAADFESQIAQVKNGDFSAFTYVNFLNSNSTSETTDKKGVVTTTVSGLDPVGEYTVYVRNVGGLRILGDGSTVAASAAGAVKTFKTIKSQTVGIRASLGEPAVYDGIDEIWRAKFTDKSAQILVDAKFMERYSQNYSDYPDYIWRKLPLDKTAKASYTAPKMVYYVSEEESDEWFEDSVYLNGYYYAKKASIASVDKKGKVTFKGKGLVYVLAIDTLSGRGDMLLLDIDASPDSVSGKPIKLRAGESIWLSGCLEYKQGKDKVVNYQHYYYDLSVAESSNEYFKIQSYDGDYQITALKSGGSLNLTVTDSEVAKNGGKPAIIKLSSTAVEPVKKLKVKKALDDRATITFEYPLPSYEFRLELKDARGKVMQNRVEQLYGAYNPKSKKYDYDVNLTGLTLLSKYNLTVTAQYGGESSKETKLKIKTTNIPASYYALDKNVMRYGGTDILVTTANYDGWLELDEVVLKSGNTYTLDVPLDGWNDNLEARQRKTDTLTWKSSNSKVASLKVLSGSYTAQLKALKPGTTVIELTSKVTKEVIARYQVHINAVGDANGFFSTNEPYNDHGTIGDGVDVEERDALAVSLDNRVYATLNKGEGQWFVFTAPAYGSYSIYDSDGYGDDQVLEKNAKMYHYIENDDDRRTVYVEVTGILYQEASLGENKVKGGKTLIFRAPEDNYYTFSYTDEYGNKNSSSYSLKKDQTWEYTVWGREGKEYTVTITKRELAGSLSTAAEGVKVSVGKDAEKWYSFTAPETQVYNFKFKLAAETDELTVERFNSLADKYDYQTGYRDGDAVKMENISLQKGDTIYFRITSDSATDDKAVEATAVVGTRTVVASLTMDEAGVKVSVPADSEAWYTLEVTEKDMMYTFRYSNTTGGMDVYAYDENGFKGLNNDSTWLFDTSSYGDKSDETLLKPGKYYLKFVNNGSETAESTIVVTKRTIAGELTEAATDISIGATGEVWYSFTAPEDNCYTFRADGVSANISADYYMSKTSTYGMSLFSGSGATHKSGEISLTEGQTIYVKLSSDAATKDKPVTANIRVTKRTVAGTIADSETASDITVGADGEAWYKFTASEANTYTFVIPRTEKAFGYTYYYKDLAKNSSNTLFSSNLAGYNDINTSNSVSLNENETIYIKFVCNTATADAPANAKVKVFKQSLRGSLKEGAEGNAISVDVNGSSWYEFKVPETQYYTFRLTEKDGAAFDNYCSYYTAVEGNYEGGMNFGNEVRLEGGKTIYLKITSSSATMEKLAEANLVVTKRTVEKQFSTTEGTAVSFTSTADEKWYSFTAPEAGFYFLDASGVQNTMRFYMYENLAGSYIDNKTVYSDAFPDAFLLARKMKAGETVYYKIEGDGYNVSEENPAQATIKVVKCESGDALTTPAEGQQVSIEEANTYKWYSFTATEANVYSVNVTSASEGLRYSIAVTDTGDFADATGTTVGLLAGQTVYIMLSSKDATADSPVEATIKVEKTRDYTGSFTEAAAGNSVSLTDAKMVYYTFTAEEDNVYTFDFFTESSSVGSYELYDSVLDEKYYARGELGNVSIKNRVMKKGDIAVVALQCVRATEANPFKVTVKISKQMNANSVLTLGGTGTAYSLDANEVAWYTFTAPKTGSYKLSFQEVVGTSQYRIYENFGDEDCLGNTSYSASKYRSHTINLEKGQKLALELQSRYGAASAKVVITEVQN